jgi:general nucleoside transport system permease protein
MDGRRTGGGLMALAKRWGASLGLALAVTFLILLVSGAPPIKTLVILFQGGLGSLTKAAQTIGVWVPLFLCSIALFLTFASGLWNIGIEGQVVLGAVAATWFLRRFDDGSAGLIAAGLACGMIGGVLWALLAGVLRVWGRVHEIFSGLGLDFVALGLTLWLIFGPWKRPGVTSMSGTMPLPESLWLPKISGVSLSPVGLILAVVAFGVVVYMLKGTYWD